MKNILLFIFALAVGTISGIAYERYIHREECLNLAFDNSGAEILSEEEISEIAKILNEDPGSNDNIGSATLESTENSKERGIDNGTEESSNKSYVGSRNSNKFYAVGCRYAKLIKEENKVWFSSVEDGGKAGRTYVDCK